MSSISMQVYPEHLHASVVKQQNECGYIAGDLDTLDYLDSRGQGSAEYERQLGMHVVHKV